MSWVRERNVRQHPILPSPYLIGFYATLFFSRWIYIKLCSNFSSVFFFQSILDREENKKKKCREIKISKTKRLLKPSQTPLRRPNLAGFFRLSSRSKYLRGKNRSVSHSNAKTSSLISSVDSGVKEECVCRLNKAYQHKMYFTFYISKHGRKSFKRMPLLRENDVRTEWFGLCSPSRKEWKP